MSIIRHLIRKLRNSAGFSLLEILIAVAILATAAATMAASASSSFLSSERAERITSAAFLARQRMAELEMELEGDMEKDKFPDDVEKQDNFPEPFDDFRWKYTIRKVEIPVMGEGDKEGQNVMVMNYIKNVTEQISKKVREVKVTVFWGDELKPEEEQEHLEVTTHIVNLK